MNPRVRDVFVIPRHLKGLQKFSSYYTIFKKLISNHYDFLAQFSVDWRGALLARFLNVDLSVAREASRRGSFWHQSFDLIAPFNDNRPVAEQDVDLLRVTKLYKKTEAPSYQLSPPQKNLLKVKQWLQAQHISKNKLIVIHASSRWKFKEIPIETWANIIDALKTKKINVVLDGSKEDLKTNQAITDLCLLKPNLTNNFSKLLGNNIIASNVIIKIKLHKLLKFRNENPEFFGKNQQDDTTFERWIGNVTVESLLTFEYTFKNLGKLL